jgi:hypothetical protein
MKKTIIVAITILTALTIKLSIFRKTSISEVPGLLAASRSKEFCSCYFLLKNSKDYCLDLVLKGYPLFNFEIRDNEVEFSNPLSKSIAKVSVDGRFGCEFSE